MSDTDPIIVAARHADTEFVRRQANYYEALNLLEQAARRHLIAHARQLVEGLVSVEVTGEWNEDSQVRLTVSAIHLNRDGKPETFDRDYEEVEALEETCQDALMLLGETNGEDYLGPNTIEGSEAP